MSTVPSYLAVVKSKDGVCMGKAYLKEHHNGVTGEVKLVGQIPIIAKGQIELVEIHHSEDDMDGVLHVVGKESNVYGMYLSVFDTLNFT